MNILKIFVARYIFMYFMENLCIASSYLREMKINVDFTVATDHTLDFSQVAGLAWTPWWPGLSLTGAGTGGMLVGGHQASSLLILPPHTQL